MGTGERSVRQETTLPFSNFQFNRSKLNISYSDSGLVNPRGTSPHPHKKYVLDHGRTEEVPTVITPYGELGTTHLEKATRFLEVNSNQKLMREVTISAQGRILPKPIKSETVKPITQILGRVLSEPIKME